MARGPDGKGTTSGGGFSLKDHLFNAESLGDLAAEFAANVDGFSAAQFVDEVLPRFANLELMERLEAMADGLEKQLSPDFETMANELTSALPPKLDPAKKDDDFGRFIHAVHGILAVRHGLEDHAPRALDLLYEATQRFSMEFYIRSFINRWPDLTKKRLRLWAQDENYHVRRLVSEGTRPKLPWAKSITLDLRAPLEFLDQLYGDSTRFVTRSVANHLNDISKKEPDLVVQTLRRWRDEGRQEPKEMSWMCRHALRGLIKEGHVGALELLGYSADAPVSLSDFSLEETQIARGAPLSFSGVLTAPADTPVIVDYVIWFQKSSGQMAPKTFKLKQVDLVANQPVNIKKIHKFKWDATTFKLFAGAHQVGLQVNGKLLQKLDFTLE